MQLLSELTQQMMDDLKLLSCFDRSSKVKLAPADLIKYSGLDIYRFRERLLPVKKLSPYSNRIKYLNHYQMR